MKKLLITLCILTLLCLPVLARDFTIPGTDMTISLDDNFWYVFTRDNLLDNPELEELGLTQAEEMQFMLSNHIFLDAYLFWEDGDYLELMVVKTTDDSAKDIGNLSVQPDSLAEEIAKELSEEDPDFSSRVYKNNYTFIESVGIDQEQYLYSFITIVNQETYCLKFQSNAPFNAQLRTDILSTVDSVVFDVDTSLNPRERNFFETRGGITLIATCVGAVGGGIAGGIIGLRAKSKRKKAMQAQQQPPLPQ